MKQCKIWICILSLILTLGALAGCGNTKSNAGGVSADLPAASASPAQSVDVDLTKLSSTMVYSEVYNMMNAPERYIGKTVKMRGQFSYYADPNTKNQYFSCIIADATACCSQGLEFILTGNRDYPNDYPELGSEITVSGVFEVYMENGLPYGRLASAHLLD